MKPVLAAALIVTASQVQALDCDIGDVADAFEQAEENARGDPHVAVIGTVAMDGLVMEQDGDPVNTPAWFMGEVLSADGLRTPLETTLTVKAVCIDGDCGYVAQGFEMLSFIHETADGPVMYSYPCHAYPVMADPQRIAAFQSCVDGGPCGASGQN